jgi:hypothetical protein
VLGGLDGTRTTEILRRLHVNGMYIRRSEAPTGTLRKPRIALFRPLASMDEGWTRWVLERFEFDFASLTDAELTTSPLRGRFDVIVVTDEPRGPLTGGGRGGRGGGAGQGASVGPGVGQAGGARQGVGRQDFFAAGSLLNVETTTTHPVMSGFWPDAAVFFNGSPAFETLDGFQGDVLARYAAEGDLLASGYLLGDSHLRGKAAALEVRHGDGKVILFGFRPQWRGQTFATFKALFNAVLRQ